MKPVTLYTSWACPFSKSVEIALKLKGISFTLIPENLFNLSLVAKKISPLFPCLPILVHDGETVSGLSIILEYIDETWKGKPSIFPKSPKGRAKARFLIKFILVKCIPAVMRVCWGREWGPARNLALQHANSSLKVLEDELNNGKKYFGGDKIGAVDISAVFIALWAEVHAEANAIKLLKIDRFPFLRKWMDSFLSNTIAKETLPTRGMLLSYHLNINPCDFRQPRKKLLDDQPQLHKLDEGKVESLEVDSGDCYGILRKLFDRRKPCNFVFPAEFPM